MSRSHEAPPALGLDASTPDDLVGQWLVLLTPPQKTKAAARMLLDMGVGYYLPMEDVMRRWGRPQKKRYLTLPLWPGYLFANVTDSLQRIEVLDHDRQTVYSHIDVTNQRELARELSMIHDVLGKATNVRTHAIEAGKTYEVETGAFRGHRGPCIATTPKTVTIVLTILGQAITVELDPEETALQVA